MKVSFSKHAEAALHWYGENGYFIEEDTLPHDLCDRLVVAGRNLSQVQAGDYRPAMQPHRTDPVFLQAMKYPVIVQTVERLVGGPPCGLQTEFFYAQPGVRGFAGHQDNFFVEAEENSFASVWIALTDVSAENGGLYGYPGSHREGRLPVRRLHLGQVEGQDPNANNEETVLPEKYERVDIAARKGSVVYLHAHFVHGSYANRSGDFRYALLCTYVRKGASFRPGRYAQREAVDLCAT